MLPSGSTNTRIQIVVASQLVPKRVGRSDEGHTKSPVEAVRVIEPVDPELKPLTAGLWQVQRTKECIPDCKRASKILIEMRWITGMVYLMMSRA